MNIKKLAALGLTTTITLSNMYICFANDSILMHKNVNLSNGTLEVYTDKLQDEETTDASKKVEIAEIMRYDENGGINIGEILDNAANIKVVPSKNSINVGEEFYVDFILNNNPGFRDYSFGIEYDPEVIVPVAGDAKEMNSAAEVVVKVKETGKVKPAVSAEVINSSINDIEDKSICQFSFDGLVNPGRYRYISAANGNGVLCRVKFKAVGKGRAAVRMNGGNKNYIIHSSSKNIPVYVQNAMVTVKN